jgi:hypothetical protein
MTTRHIASSRPAASAPDPARHRRIPTAAAIAAIAALVASGGYLATTHIGPDATPPTAATGTELNPSAQTLRELHQSVAGQYGARSAPGTTVNPSAQTRRELHQRIAGQYGSRPAAGTVVNPSARTRRELDQSLAGQYGPTR